MAARESFLRRRLVLGSAALVSVAVSFAFLFKAGCTGDAKGGALGDPIAALRYESFAFPFLLLGLAIGALVIAIRPAPSERHRFAHGLAFFIFGGLVLWLVGIQFEGLGVQYCF